MQIKSFVVTLASDDIDVDTIDLFAYLSGTWEGVYVTIEAAQPAAAKQTTEWVCQECYKRNLEAVDYCVNCETRRSGTERQMT
jgi:hypothetical protein